MSVAHVQHERREAGGVRPAPIVYRIDRHPQCGTHRGISSASGLEPNRKFDLSLDEAIGVPEKKEIDLLALDQALEGLAALDPQQGRIVELRFFGGLSIEETAEVLHISTATVKRDWVMAKAWLYQNLSS